jgi:hypothetical protein
MTKEIPLTKGKVALVDDEDFEYLSQFKWQYQQDKQTGYAKRGVYLGGGRANSKWKIVMMHKEVMKAEQTQKIDHKDGNGLNNQKDNLRHCDSAQNMRNSKKRSALTSSPYKGVCYQKKRNRYLASIAVDGKKIFLGRFFQEDDAARAYNEAATKLFGEFALLNVVD